MYPVTLERVHHNNETSKGQRLSTESNASKGDNAVDSKSGGSSAKKLKLMDQDKIRVIFVCIIFLCKTKSIIVYLKILVIAITYDIIGTSIIFQASL